MHIAKQLEAAPRAPAPGLCRREASAPLCQRAAPLARETCPARGGILSACGRSASGGLPWPRELSLTGDGYGQSLEGARWHAWRKDGLFEEKFVFEASTYKMA